MTIDNPMNPGSCCIANQRHPDHCLCSGADIDDPNNPGSCCFKDENYPTQCLCNGNSTDDPKKSKITKKCVAIVNQKSTDSMCQICIKNDISAFISNFEGFSVSCH